MMSPASLIAPRAPADPEVITMVMVVAVLGLVILFALAAELGNRASKSNPTRAIEES